ncbi:hypothetical protein Agabi119p4_8460 [Agaricus bisporus var. burnettii]|uniref:Uncharacterized protein n=1 Tax=Agaricus bisporus var. burnettii TaxID=192524 RepID=A0A8H7C5V9_AGABI|nr:hypothetical protein Agabi119p4_8460 [Agaricus bisporus var. burnettii]
MSLIVTTSSLPHRHTTAAVIRSSTQPDTARYKPNQYARTDRVTSHISYSLTLVVFYPLYSNHNAIYT